MLALVVMDHALRQRAQCGDVRSPTPPIPAQRALTAGAVADAPPRRTLLAFGAVSFAYFAYAGLFCTYAPLWYQSLGYSTFAIGVLTSVQSATRVFEPYAWGWIGRPHRPARAAAAARRGGALICVAAASCSRATTPGSPRVTVVALRSARPA